MPWPFETHPKCLRYERTAGVKDPPVPRDRLLKPRFRFPGSSFDEVARAFEIGHLVSEAVYAGDGCWDCPGDYPSPIRNCANRVRGYAIASRVLGDETYRIRAAEGIGYLLRAQYPEGDFPCFDKSHNGVRGPEDGLFETAAAGRALIEHHRSSGDARCLEASRVAAEWEMACPLSSNVRDNMAAVSHLVAHHEAAPDARVIESAVERARASAITNQLACGGWPGRDSWMWNHGTITRGLADLLRVLPEGHAFEHDLRACLTAALNRSIRLQAASGEALPNFRVHVRGHTCAHTLDALLAARGLFGDAFEDCIRGIVRFRLARTPDESFARAYAGTWRNYVGARERVRDAATGETAWRAQLDHFVKDTDLGEVAVGALDYQPAERSASSGSVRWVAASSERTGGGAQRIDFVGGPVVGGMGWSIPAGALTPGMRYRFAASVRCSGDTQTLPLVFCSADGESAAEFTRESPTFGSYSIVSICFTAAAEANTVWVWSFDHSSSSGLRMRGAALASITVDEAMIADAGRPLPPWDPALDAFERHQDMILLPTAEWLSRP